MRGSLPLIAGAALTTLGLVVAGTTAPVPGGVACLAGWSVLVVAIHRAGRAGGSDAIDAAARR